MSKVAHYLQEHLSGEVMESNDARAYFANDASIFTVTPSIIVYPRNEVDVRKTARFTWQLAERGRVIPITARGNGTDLSGAAIGSGIVLVFPAHMHRIVELNGKTGDVIVEPGTNYGKLQQALITHDRFIPPAPNSLEFSTIGGAVANNAGGDKSVKYGDTASYVKSLRVVLANGEIIITEKLSKRELSKKLGLSTLEGEIYRAVDTLLEEESKKIGEARLAVTKNVAGYNLFDINTKEGFNLTPLFLGSQGTLGIITEITLASDLYNPETTLMIGSFDDEAKLEKAIIELRELPEMPSSIELVNDALLNLVDQINPNLLKGAVDKPFPKLMLLVEFDDLSDRTRKHMAKKAAKILARHGKEVKSSVEPAEKANLMKIRQAVSTVLAQAETTQRALPFIEDSIVPLNQYSAFLKSVDALLSRNQVKPILWGHAGDAHLHVQPLLDLDQVGDRQRLFRISEEMYKLVHEYGGSTTAQHGDGRVRAPYLSEVYGEDMYQLFTKVKQIFDPYGILNPGVKIGVDSDTIKPLLRRSYTLAPWYEHLPRT